MRTAWCWCESPFQDLPELTDWILSGAVSTSEWHWGYSIHFLSGLSAIWVEPLRSRTETFCFSMGGWREFSGIEDSGIQICSGRVWTYFESLSLLKHITSTVCSAGSIQTHKWNLEEQGKTLPETANFPAWLPCDHLITRIITRDCHHRMMYDGVRLRSRFCLTKGQQVIRKHLRLHTM